MKTIAISKGRKMLAGLVAGALALSVMAPSAAFALTADEATAQAITHAEATNNSGNTQYWLQLASGSGEGGLDDMSVDVPVRVNLALSAEGEFVTPTALKNVIENKSEFPLDVSAMSIAAKDGFTLKPATSFGTLNDSNIFHGKIESVALNADRSAVSSTKQAVAFSKLGSFTTNAAWRMEASDNNDRYGNDCLFIQIGGGIGNVSGKYFTAPINVFDITYTFAAASADATATGAAITD